MEKLSLTLNYKGEDVSVEVDMETANIILNDPQQLEIFCKNVLDGGNDEVKDITDDNANSENNDGPSPSTSFSCKSSVWSSRCRPSEEDNMATEMFLALRKKYAHFFDDRKTVKFQLWKKIADEIYEKGVFVGHGKEGAIKCQKFTNLTRMYLQYNKHNHITGTETIPEPPYYNEIHAILGYKDKVNPQNLQDSLAEEEEEAAEESESSSTSSVTDIKNRFQNIPNKLKPRKSSNGLLEEIKKQHEESMSQRDKQFQLLEEHLKKRNEQTDRLLDLMETLVKQNRGTKRKSSEESS